MAHAPSFETRRITIDKKRTWNLFEKSLTPEASEAARQAIMQVTEMPERYIDKGGAGVVYRLENGLCVKVIENRHFSPNKHLLDLRNSVPVEAAIQQFLTPLRVKEVRVPYCLGFSVVEDYKIPSLILMEELPAVNLQQAINKTVPFPEAFKVGTFMDGLYDFVAEMQGDYAIAHDDLEARNVMIDKTTGLAYVIDFGRAIRLNMIKEEQKRDQYESADFKNLEKIEKTLKNIHG